MMNQGHKIIDPGVIWKGFINWVSIPHMNFLYLTVQNVWQRLKFFWQQTNRHTQAERHADRQDKTRFPWIAFERDWGVGVMRVFPQKNFSRIDAKLCYSRLIWTNLDEKLGLKDTVFIWLFSTGRHDHEITTNFYIQEGWGLGVKYLVANFYLLRSYMGSFNITRVK